MEFFSFFLERNWSAEYKKKGKGRGGKYLEKRNIWSTGRGGRKTDEENILIFSLKLSIIFGQQKRKIYWRRKMSRL